MDGGWKERWGLTRWSVNQSAPDSLSFVVAIEGLLLDAEAAELEAPLSIPGVAADASWGITKDTSTPVGIVRSVSSLGRGTG